MKSARGFGSSAAPWDTTSNPPTLAADGWPTEDFGVYFVTLNSDALGRDMTVYAPSVFGTYSLSFHGQATISSVGGLGVVHNQAYNSATGVTTAEVVVSATWTGVNSQGGAVGLTFTNTQYNATLHGLKNVQLLRPGYSFGANGLPTQTFTNEFTKAVAPFSNLRFMDTLCTNGNSISLWTQRNTPAWPLQSDCSRGGIAYEYIIQLANLLGKDVWINIPGHVNLSDTTSNNYAHNLALMIQAQLTNNKSHVYLEFANENWNTEFEQSFWTQYQACLAVTSGKDLTLNLGAAAASNVACGTFTAPHWNGQNYVGYVWTGDANFSWYWGWRRIAQQAILMGNIFRSVMGDAAMMTKIRPVLAFQVAYPYLMEDLLYYVSRYYGAPSQFFYGIAGAVYFGPGAGTFTNVTQLLDAIAAGLVSQTEWFTPGTLVPAEFTQDTQWSGMTFINMAEYYGIKSLGYEGGFDTSLTTNSQVALEQLYQNTRTTQLLESYYQQWFGCGNDLVNYYNLATAQGGQWGIYEDVTIANARSAAILSIASTPLSSFNSGMCPA